LHDGSFKRYVDLFGILFVVLGLAYPMIVVSTISLSIAHYTHCASGKPRPRH